jgi:hypothetical protein
MATKPHQDGLNAEQAAILTSGNFVLHAVYQGGTDGRTRGAIYRPLYVVGVENGVLEFIAEPVGEIRTMRALNLFENAPHDMPPKVMSPHEKELDQYIGFYVFLAKHVVPLAVLAQEFETAFKAYRSTNEQ